MNPNEWIDQYTDYLFSYAYLKIGKREDAEDLVQETFLSAYKNRNQFKGQSAEKTWLVAILKNKIIDYYRKKNRDFTYVDYLDESEDTFESTFFNTNYAGGWNEGIHENYFSSSADGYIHEQEFQSILAICLAKLPSKLKAVFIAKYIDEDKVENICKDFDVSPSNYWVMVFRSKILLRACLEKSGMMPE